MDIFKLQIRADHQGKWYTLMQGNLRDCERDLEQREKNAMIKMPMRVVLLVTSNEIV